MTNLERTLFIHMRAKLDELPESEYRFHPTRRWRFDFAWPKRRLAVECEGGVWTQGRHVRGKGYEGDIDKRNAAVLLGWRVLHFTAKHINDGTAISTIQEALNNGNET